MKVIIAGGREHTNFNYVEQAVEASGFRKYIKVVVSGHAMGIDSLGER